MALSRSILSLFLVLCCFLSPSLAEDLQLTSEKMRYDSETGMFWAEGSVKLVRGSLTATSLKAEGNVNGKDFAMTGDVHVFGSWEGEKMDMRGDKLSGTFEEPRGYVFEGKVKGFWGPRQVDGDRLEWRGERFSGTKIRRYSDSREGYVLECDAIDGNTANGEVSEFVATGNIHFVSASKDRAPTDLRGDKAVYSKAMGSLVVSGNVAAVQEGRSLKAETLVYFPEKNRIEASGKPQLIFKMEEGKQKK